MNLALILLLSLLWSASGDPDGRKANELYREGRYREAADAYLAALDELGPEGSPELQAALLNNLGSALYKMEDFETALQTFVRSLASSRSPADKSRAAYNAGNAAYRQKNLQAALSFFKQALLEDEANGAARFNFEYVRRQVKDQDQQQQDSGGKIEPSEYARALKRQAEDMVARRQYRAAHSLMMDGLRIDESVRAFQDFIGRIGNVAEIDNPEA